MTVKQLVLLIHEINHNNGTRNCIRNAWWRTKSNLWLICNVFSYSKVSSWSRSLLYLEYMILHCELWTLGTQYLVRNEGWIWISGPFTAWVQQTFRFIDIVTINLVALSGINVCCYRGWKFRYSIADDSWMIYLTAEDFMAELWCAFRFWTGVMANVVTLLGLYECALQRFGYRAVNWWQKKSPVLGEAWLCC